MKTFLIILLLTTADAFAGLNRTLVPVTLEYDYNTITNAYPDGSWTNYFQELVVSWPDVLDVSVDTNQFSLSAYTWLSGKANLSDMTTALSGKASTASLSLVAFSGAYADLTGRPSFTNGTNGINGAPGLNGTNGATGATGFIGATGPTGATGPAGTNIIFSAYSFRTNIISGQLYTNATGHEVIISGGVTLNFGTLLGNANLNCLIGPTFTSIVAERTIGNPTLVGLTQPSRSDDFNFNVPAGYCFSLSNNISGLGSSVLLNGTNRITVLP